MHIKCNFDNIIMNKYYTFNNFNTQPIDYVLQYFDGKCLMVITKGHETDTGA